MTDRLLTVKDAMEIIPLGKTKVTQIINSIPHINTGGKLLFSRKDLEAWIAMNKVTGKQKETAPLPKPRKRPRIEGLTADGLIPYRKRGA
jgi:hypothetical protein